MPDPSPHLEKVHPVLLFAYKRISCLKNTVDALRNNFLAQRTELYVFCDGPRTEEDKLKVDAVIDYVRHISGFRKVFVEVCGFNRGLSKSVIHGVSKVLEKHEAVIVLEDDLVTSRNFLVYMNSSLHQYRSEKGVYSVSGYTFPISRPRGYPFDNYFHRRGCSWGWGTWRDRWQAVNWQLLHTADSNLVARSTLMGSDFPKLVKKFKQGTIDSWAVPWCYHGFVQNLFTVYPTSSKIRNTGFDTDATHTKGVHQRFETSLDESDRTSFHYSMHMDDDPYYLKEFNWRFSYYERMKSRLMTELQKILH